MSGLSKPNRIDKKLSDMKPEEVHLHVFIPEGLHRKLKQKGLDENVPIREIVKQALESHLRK